MEKRHGAQLLGANYIREVSGGHLIFKGVVSLESKSLHLKIDLIISLSVVTSDTSDTRLNRKDSCLAPRLSVRVNKGFSQTKLRLRKNLKD